MNQITFQITYFLSSFLLLLSTSWSSPVNTKQLALTFDDAPTEATPHSNSVKRTELLIEKLKTLNVPPVMVFANPCKGDGGRKTLLQLKKYKDAGHRLANHTCSHPRLDNVGADIFIKDIWKAEKLLASLVEGQKFLRFPYLNEGTQTQTRDQIRAWLKSNQYRNGYVSIDNDDYLFSAKINEAKKKNKAIDYAKVETLFIDHVVGAAEFYNQLAVKNLGRSPKHVLLLHEVDVTVQSIDKLVAALKEKGWSIISIDDAYKDELYINEPINNYANNGIISQIIYEKTKQKSSYTQFEELKIKLNKILGL